MEGFGGRFVYHSHVAGMHQHVLMSLRREKKDYPIDYEITVPIVLFVQKDTLCVHGVHQFNRWREQQATHGVHLAETIVN